MSSSLPEVPWPMRFYLAGAAGWSCFLLPGLVFSSVGAAGAGLAGCSAGFSGLGAGAALTGFSGLSSFLFFLPKVMRGQSWLPAKKPTAPPPRVYSAIFKIMFISNRLWFFIYKALSSFQTVFSLYLKLT